MAYQPWSIVQLRENIHVCEVTTLESNSENGDQCSMSFVHCQAT